MEKCQENAKKRSSMPSVTTIQIGTLSGLRYSEHVMCCLETRSVPIGSSLKHGKCSNLRGGIFRDRS